MEKITIKLIDQTIDKVVKKHFKKEHDIFFVPENYCWSHYIYDQLNNKNVDIRNYDSGDQNQSLIFYHKTTIKKWLKNALLNFVKNECQCLIEIAQYEEEENSNKFENDKIKLIKAIKEKRKITYYFKFINDLKEKMSKYI